MDMILQRISRLGCAAALALGSVPSAWAAPLPPPPGQTLQSVRPVPSLPQAPGSVFELPAPPQQNSKAKVTLSVSHVEVVGNSILTPAQIQVITEPLAKHTVTLGQLNQAANQLTAALHRQGFPLAYAYLPAQKIKAGVVQIKVVEPSYDQINIKPSRLDTQQASNTLNLHSGELIEESSLNRGLLLLNQTPGIRVAGTLIPGTRNATSSLDVAPEDLSLFDGSVGVNNYGSRNTGRTQWQTQVDLRNPFGYGSQFSASGLTTSGGLLHSGGLSFLSPNLWDGLRGNLFYSSTHYRLGGPFADLGVTGRAQQWGAGLNYPLILEPGQMLNAQLNFTQNRFHQSSLASPGANDTRLNLIALGFNGAKADSTGVTSYAVTVTSGNKAISDPAQQAADAAGPQTAGHFWFGQLRGQRQQQLPAGLRLDVQLQGQVASRNLDASQQIYLGGSDGVLSGDVGSGAGDQGLLGRFSLSHRIPLAAPGELRLAALLQAGTVWQYRSVYPGALAAGEDNRQSLAAAGLGLSYTSRGVSARLQWVHRVGGPLSQSGDARDNQIWASLTLYPSAFF